METRTPSSQPWHAFREEAETLAAPLPPLMVEAERIANTVAQGLHGRRKIGVGETFWEYRHHRPQDPLTAIDWRQSAKSDHLYVRENEWEAAETIWFWRGASPTMSYRSAFGPCTKQDRATVLTLATASLLTRGNERFAGLNTGQPPTTGRTALRRLAMGLLDSAPKNAPSLPNEQPLPRFSQLILISDFLSDFKDLEKVIRFYAEQGIIGHMLHVLDPAEEDLPFEGRTRFVGLGEKISLTVARAQNLRKDYQTRLADHRANLGELAGRLGWTFATHRTDRPAQTALLALYTALAGETMRDVGQ